MLKALWNLLGRTNGGTEKIQPAGPPLWEPLEPRLLLNADLAGAGPLDGESASADSAIHVDRDQPEESTEGDVTPVLTLNGGGAPDLPGLRLVDSNLSNWQGQIIYLDFDGAQNVTYDGPVTIGPFDIPAFRAPGALAGQEQTIIADVLARLQATFAGSGVLVTLNRPAQTQSYSTIYIGGNDSVWKEYGSFLGLAEAVDAGNAGRTDAGFVFSETLLGPAAAGSEVREELSGAIAHEIGHLLGYEHEAEQPAGASVLSEVALLGITALGGEGIEIANGDVTPSTTDGTVFGTVAQGSLTVSRVFTVRNDAVTTRTLGAVTVPTGYTLTEPLSASLAPGAWDSFTVRLDTAVTGTKTGDISFTIDGSEENRYSFRITGTVIGARIPAEQFTGGTDSFDLAHQAILFTPEGTGYTFAARTITELPTSTAGAVRLTMGDDDAILVNLDLGAEVILHGQSYDHFYVGSNGYITFTQPDTNYGESLAEHFDTPRISALFDDLTPTAGGQISYQQLPDRVVVTWDQVADYNTGGACTFQATMYFNGRIELAWLAVASPDGIVGLSDGSELPSDFTEADFSTSASAAPEITVLGNEVEIANGDTTPDSADHTDFGTVVQGGAAPARVFTVRNDGTSDLVLGEVTVPAGFTLIDNLATSLAPGQSDTFTVRLNTGTAGIANGDVSFSANDNDEDPFHFRITGLVIAPAEVTVLGNGNSIRSGDATPSPLDHTDFGSAVQGGPGLTRTFTVRNDGGLSLTLGAVSVPAGFTLLEPLADTLGPGASDTFTVQLDTVVAGTKSGEIVFSNNDGDENPFRFRITGTVLLPGGPEVMILGSGVVILSGDTTPGAADYTDFWQVDVGRTATRTFTIRNVGEGTLHLTGSPHVTLSGSTDFSVFVQPADSVVGGGTTAFLIQFRPSSAGLKTATVRIATDDADENPYTFALQGTGVVWDFTFYDDFDDHNWAGWNAVDPQTGAPRAEPQVVASPEGFALAGLGSGYGLDPNWQVMLTHALNLTNVGELKIAMRAQAGPDQPNGVQVQLIDGSEYYTVVDYWLDSWDPDDKADWYSWVDNTGRQHRYNIAGEPGSWHDFTWTRDAQGRWSLFIDGQLIAADFQREGQLISFNQVAIGLLRDQSQIEWVGVSANDLADHSAAKPVYRFWSPVTGRHFYTISESERNSVISKYPGVWTYEGIAYYAYGPDQPPAGTTPVYRFWSGTLRSHFYTTSLAERDKLINSLSHVWAYEGAAFHAYAVGAQPVGTYAVCRFWSNSLGGHFYTMNRAERDKLLNVLAQVWTYESIAWYAYEA